MYDQDKEFRTFLDNFKATHSCVDYLASLGFNIPYSGALIITPRQFRADDHDPSFAVYHNGAFDYGTHTFYDIFALDMTLRSRTFFESVEALTGYRFSGTHPVISARFENNLTALQKRVQKWHELLLTNPVTHRIAQDRDEGALDYLLDRKLTLEYIKREQIGYDPAFQRIIFPYRKNGQIVYVAGRDFSGLAELPKGDPRKQGVNKYWKHPIMFGLEHCPWGLHTIRGQRLQRAMYKGADNEFYESPFYDNPKDDTLIICEGMVDVSVFAQNGWQCISPVGGDFRKQVIPFVLDLARMFRQVFICFDNDGKGTEFQRNWAQRLFEAQIPFICGHTAESGSPKFDVADYYRAACNNATPGQDEQKAGADALEDLVRKAIPGVVEISKSLYSYERIAKFLEKSARFCRPYDLMSLKNALLQKTRPYIDEQGRQRDIPLFSKKDLTFMFTAATACPPEQQTAEEIIAHHTLTYSIDDAFYEFNGRCWEKKHDQFIRRYIYSALGRKAGDNRVSKVLKTLRTMLADDKPFDEQHVFTFQNGTLLLDENDEGGHRGRLVRLSPEYRATIHVPYKYDVSARNTQWEEFIRDVCLGNTALARELQKAAGYVLMADNSLHKMFYLIGDGRNGKSTFLSVISAVFGEDNCSSVRPDRLCEEFAPMAMKGKLLNICYEGGRYLNGSEESLKGIVAGDPIMAAHKGVDAVKFIPRAKVFVAANNMFNAKDVSQGFLSRFVFLPFSNAFEPGNPELVRELKADLPGIFNWCLEGYRMLLAEGFKEGEAQAKSRRKFEEHIEPLRIFMRETFTADFEKNRPLGDAVLYSEYPSLRKLYTSYKNWSIENGYRYTNRGIFSERVSWLAPRMSRSPELAKMRVKEIDGIECLIIPELHEHIIYSALAGANNESHTEYARECVSRGIDAGQVQTERERENELPAQDGTADNTPHDPLPPHSEGEGQAGESTGTVCSALLENEDVRAIINRYEQRSEMNAFIRRNMNARTSMLRAQTLSMFNMSGAAAWGIAITLADNTLGSTMPLRLALAVYDALKANPEYSYMPYPGWIEEHEARVAAQLSAWGISPELWQGEAE